MTKREQIYALLDQNPTMSDVQLSIKTNCSVGYANSIRRERQEEKLDELRKNGNDEYPNAIMPGEAFKAVVLADPHCPYHVRRIYETALDYTVKINPNVLILLGDYVDFNKISYWRGDPHAMPFEEEVEMAKLGLAELASILPDAKKYYMEGNHEERLQQYLYTNAPEIAKFKGINISNLLELDNCDFQYISSISKICANEPPWSVGKLYLIHGHEKKIAMTAVNHAKLFYDYCKVNLMAAHHHKSSEEIVKKMNFKLDGAWTVGCLCDLSPRYQPINKWNWGLAVIDVESNGDFSVQNKKIINGKVR